MLTLIATLFLGACANDAPLNTVTASTSTEQDIALSPELKEGLTYALEATPYAALIHLKEHTRIPLTDAPAGEVPTEIRIEYVADVIETLRGTVQQQIRFYQVVEQGEAPMIMQTPFIISLCQHDTGYYWPGTGSAFPYSEEALNHAKEVALQPTNIDAIAAYCD